MEAFLQNIQRYISLGAARRDKSQTISTFEGKTMKRSNKEKGRKQKKKGRKEERKNENETRKKTFLKNIQRQISLASARRDKS